MEPSEEDLIERYFRYNEVHGNNTVIALGQALLTERAGNGGLRKRAQRAEAENAALRKENRKLRDAIRRIDKVLFNFSLDFRDRMDIIAKITAKQLGITKGGE